MSVYRRNERWMVDVTIRHTDGRRERVRQVSPVNTRRGAQAHERKVREAVTNGTWRTQPARQVPTLAEFAEEFMAFQETINKPTELKSKRSILRPHLVPELGTIRLNAIGAREIDRHKVRKLKPPADGRGAPSTRRRQNAALSPKTVNNHLAVLKRIFSVAKKWGLVPEPPPIEMVKADKPAFDFLTEEETERLIAATGEAIPSWQPLIVVAVRTGLRVGELLALRWVDLDLEAGRLRVERNYTRAGGFGTPKSGRTHEVPLAWDAVEALQEQRGGVDDELVFPRPEGGVGSLRSVDWALRKAAKAAGLRHINPHVLRHTFASHAVMNNVPLKVVQEWLGHASIEMTMRYAHLADGIHDELIQRLAPPRRDLRLVSTRHNGGTVREAKRETAS